MFPETATKIAGSFSQLISSTHLICYTVTAYVYYETVKRNVKAAPWAIYQPRLVPHKTTKNYDILRPSNHD